MINKKSILLHKYFNNKQVYSLVKTRRNEKLRDSFVFKKDIKFFLNKQFKSELTFSFFNYGDVRYCYQYTKLNKNIFSRFLYINYKGLILDVKRVKRLNNLYNKRSWLVLFNIFFLFNIYVFKIFFIMNFFIMLLPFIKLQKASIA